MALPTLTYNKFGTLGSTQSLSTEELDKENNIHVRENDFYQESSFIMIVYRFLFLFHWLL